MLLIFLFLNSFILLYKSLHFLAGMTKRREEFKKLLKNSDLTQVNAEDDSGYTPLHVAVNAGIKSNVSMLLLHGADASLKTRTGETVFHMLYKVETMVY